MWEVNYKESWALKNWCFWTVILERTLENLLDCKEIKPVNPEGNQSWIFIERIYEAAEAPISGHLMWKTDSLERPWCWERLKAGGRGGNRGWDGWMVSAIQCTWVWANSGSWWCTRKCGMLQAMGSQRVRLHWATELTDMQKKKIRPYIQIDSKCIIDLIRS